jgi:hypothetical protein
MLKTVVSFAVICTLTASGGALADPTGPSPTFNPPKQYYLALGDSLAFGFQFAIFNQRFPTVPPELFRGYVDDFSQMLPGIRPDLQTMNLTPQGIAIPPMPVTR